MSPGHISHRLCNFCNALVTGSHIANCQGMTISPLPAVCHCNCYCASNNSAWLDTADCADHTSLRVAGSLPAPGQSGKVKCFISYDIPFCHGFQTSTSTLPGELKLGAQIHDSHMWLKPRFVEILEIDYVTYCAKDILFLPLVCSSLNWNICVFCLSPFKRLGNRQWWLLSYFLYGPCLMKGNPCYAGYAPNIKCFSRSEPQ